MTEKIFYGFIAIVLTAFAISMIHQIRISPSKAEEQAVIEKYGCKPTNEFVGKNGDRLWLCADGMKYKHDVFYSWAREEKANK